MVSATAAWATVWALGIRLANVGAWQPAGAGRVAAVGGWTGAQCRREMVLGSGGTLLAVGGLTAWTAPARGEEPPLAPLAASVESYGGANPGLFVQRGMERFKRGRVRESVEDFDRAMALKPAYGDVLWQRGLALYYLGDYAAAQQQFLRDTRLNPADTEESIWHLISGCRRGADDFQAKQKGMLRTERDRRPYMRLAYDVFRGTAEVSELVAMAEETGADPSPFYARLYLALYEEARGRDVEALGWLERAVAAPYGPRTGDYMWHLARVHRDLRRNEKA